MLRQSVRLSALLTLVALFLTSLGCDYVNIPQTTGDVAEHDPNRPLVQRVTVESLRAALADRPIDGVFAIALPKGTLATTYQAVTSQVGDRALAANSEPREGVPTLDVKQVYVRGWKAHTDIVRPANAAQPTGVQQLVTVYLRYDPVAGWYLDSVRTWRVDVREALRLSQQDIEPPTEPQSRP